MAIGFWQTLATLPAAGTALTAAARASLTQGTTATQARFTLPGNALKNLGDMISVEATGIISCAVTTPGTARFDLAVATAAVMDTNAMLLNIVAQTNTPWYLKMLGTVTTLGTGGVITWSGVFLSPASVNVALQSSAAGPGPGGTIIPWSATATGASTASAAINLTISNLLDLYFTQTASTGSCQLLQMNIALLTATGF
jgi:hypothetical protein